MVEANVNVNATNLHGNTALIEAAGKDHTEIMEVLIKAGAVDRENYEGKTALIMAAENRNIKIISLLLENLKKGADMGAKSNDKKTEPSLTNLNKNGVTPSF